ncbi:MAG TPA: response regulator transcription factor [Ignavibacteriaceae bacterium]|nr:response regulator transcription factor [Ignavibacteriaceae bacterium]
MKKILVIEDDPAVAEALKATLAQHYFDITLESNGEKGFNQAKAGNFELIILDLTLPDIDGIDICRSLRKEGINSPILMLTGRKEEIDKVLGLEIGADDYVTKPFSSNELIARIHALLRRTVQKKMELEEYTFGDIHLDFKKHEVFKGETAVQLSAMEFKLLKYFAEREGEVISRDQLLDEVWGYDQYPTTRTVDNYILLLRKKIENDPSCPKHILTFHKAGYKFVK